MLTSEALLEMYDSMLTIRFVEEELSRLYGLGLVPGSLDLCVGQEGVAVGVCTALRRDDKVTTNHRGHGHMIAKGMDLKRLLAELFGKADGYCRGKGGSMHVADAAVGVYASGIVAGGMPIAAGLALAAVLAGRDDVAVCFFGDGAAQQGQFHETINIAAVEKLPVVFVCENNQFAVTTRASDVMPTETIAERAGAYGIPGELIEGNNIVEVYEAAQRAVDRARAGDGPTLLEALTYRVSPQVEGEDRIFATRSPYRDAAEVERWREPDRDPIARFEAYLIEVEALAEDSVANRRETVFRNCTTAFEYAQGAALPDPAEAFEDVYASEVELL